MNKDKIIKKSSHFTQIINTGLSVKSPYFSIYYCQSNDNLYGISIPKKIGKAYLRNKLKRQIKNIIINNEKDIQKCANYVIITKEPAKTLNYKLLQEELLKLMKKVRI